MSAAFPDQILTCQLATEIYGVDIQRVQEIRGWTVATRIPHSPAHVLGVLNMRGAVIPVVDLRMRFDLDKFEYKAMTVIIVMTFINSGVRRNFGLVVDGVSEVLNVHTAQIRPAPELANTAAIEHISGLLPTSKHMVILLDIDSLIGVESATTH
jgi:purine-binding chemotaxis protein CheW